MNMCRNWMIPVLAMGILACSLGPAVGQTHFIKPDEVNNAALIYWQSFALLPSLDEDQTKLINDVEVHVWADDPKITEAEGKELIEILELCEDSVRLIDQISADTPCDWGIVFAGPGTHLAHIGKARLLAKILQLSGDKALLFGMQDLAAKRFAQALRLGRHLGNDAIVLHLVGEKIEEYVVATVTRHIDSAPKAANCNLLAKGLSERIGNLPARSAVADAYRKEKQYFHGWIEKILLGNDDNSDEELEAAENLFQADGWGKFLKSSPVADRKRALEEMGKYYDQLIAFGEDSGSDVESRLEEWRKNADNSIPRSVLLAMMPSSDPITRSRNVTQAWEEFQAKLAQASE